METAIRRQAISSLQFVARLIARDTATGKTTAGFGDNGVVNIRIGLRIPPRDSSDYEETSPPAVIGNIVVVGSGLADKASVGQASGGVRGKIAEMATEVDLGSDESEEEVTRGGQLQEERLCGVPRAGVDFRKGNLAGAGIDFLVPCTSRPIQGAFDSRPIG